GSARRARRGRGAGGSSSRRRPRRRPARRAGRRAARAGGRASLRAPSDTLGVKQVGGEIALAGVGEDGEHHGAPAELPRDADRRRARRAGGDADQKPLEARQRARVLDGLLVRDRDHLVVDGSVEDLGHEARADPLDVVKARLAARQHGRRGRLDGVDGHVGALAAQHLADAGDGAARADPGHEGVDLRELGQDLGRGRAAVDLRVGGIRELLRHVPVGVLGEHLLGLADGAVHALRVGREHERRAVGDEEGAALLAHRVGHGEHEAVALDRCHQCEADAGVAAGRLDDRAARPDEPVALGHLLLALPALRALRAGHAGARVTAVVSQPLRALVELTGVADATAALEGADAAALFGGERWPSWLDGRPFVYSWLGGGDDEVRARVAAAARGARFFGVERGRAVTHAAVAYARAVGARPRGGPAALLGRAALYLGNDSGVSHLAGAVGAAGVVLFGPTEGRRWRPLAGRLVALGARGGGPDGIPLAALPAARVIAACARRFTLTRGDPDTNVAGHDLTGRS